MAANVETMFYTGRETPWHGLGTSVETAPSSREALMLAGLDWKVIQKNVYTDDWKRIPDYVVNVRDSDDQILGVVTGRYKVVQNEDAFAFTDDLLGNGVRYETAGSLKNGKKVWILAKLPQTYRVAEDRVMPYLVFSNSHDGSGSIKVAMTPIRVVCQNTLNLALSTAERIWSTAHTGDMDAKLEDARMTLFMAQDYMNKLSQEADELCRKRVSDAAVQEYIKLLLPIPDNASEITESNIIKLRRDMGRRYANAPDLKHVGKNGYRFVNAVSDFATHAAPLRRTQNYKENLFLKTMEGNPMIDKAYELVRAA